MPGIFYGQVYTMMFGDRPLRCVIEKDRTRWLSIEDFLDIVGVPEELDKLKDFLTNYSLQYVRYYDEKAFMPLDAINMIRETAGQILAAKCDFDPAGMTLQ